MDNITQKLTTSHKMEVTVNAATEINDNNPTIWEITLEFAQSLEVIRPHETRHLHAVVK